MIPEPFDASRAAWRKSSRSNGNNGNCVEVAEVGGHARVRDSKQPHGPVLVFPFAAWAAFIEEAKAGTFDL